MSRTISRVQLKHIISKFTKHFPAEYADIAWDNTGLLIDCSTESGTLTEEPKVLLTVDLIQDVAQEAIDKKCSLIITYHPFIFPSFKCISPATNPQHKSMLKLIQNGISVYSPHTAVDAAKNGVNDWLAEGLVRFDKKMIEKCVAIESTKAVPNDDTIGYGRFVTLANDGVRLSDLVKNIKEALSIKHLQITPNYFEKTDKPIKTVALCAGSGSGVFKALSEQEQDAVDVYYTGELSHHEILRLKELGKIVITCNHSNTERGYLSAVMQKLLTKEGIECSVSNTDHDPLVVL